MYFTSPISNITPALTSVAMSRSDSRDSTYSNISTTHFTSAPMTVSYSTSPMHSYTHSLTRTTSNNSAGSSSSSSQKSCSSSQRRDSASTWLPSPYRSCMLHTSKEEQHEPSSYLSDDDLLFLAPPNTLPIESIPNPEPILRKKDLTTEEQIAMLRELQDKEHEQKRSAGPQKTVRFASEYNKPRRPSTLRRRTTAVKKGLSTLNGPM